VRVEIYLALVVLATGSALLFGTRGERLIGATILVGNLLTVLIERLPGESFSSVSIGYLVLDAALAAILCTIAVRYPSWVAICVSSFQINGTLGHLVKLFAAHTIPFSYAFLLKFWAWPMILALLAGRWLPAMHGLLISRNWPPFMKRV
jgi:hypothetical protein